MTMFKSTPNIGIKLAEHLNQVGINNRRDLEELGAENAFIRIKTLDPMACINTLYALEGAVQNIRWHHLPSNRKLELLDFFQRCNAKQAIK